MRPAVLCSSLLALCLITLATILYSAPALFSGGDPLVSVHQGGRGLAVEVASHYRSHRVTAGTPDPFPPGDEFYDNSNDQPSLPSPPHSPIITNLTYHRSRILTKLTTPTSHRSPLTTTPMMHFRSLKTSATNSTSSHTTNSTHLRLLFPLLPSFSFPQPSLTLPPAQVDHSQWITNLRQLLLSFPGRSITMVTSNKEYRDVLLNWLISAVVRSNIPLNEILVVSLDSTLHHLLTQRGIQSILILPDLILKPQSFFATSFERVMMLRLAIMRLLCHWGFDVHNYDTDAVLLKDPAPLYNEMVEGGSDIIGSVGRIPEDLMEEWGITICIGVVIIRSNGRTEEYWEAMPSSCTSSHDDQEKLNCPLKSLGMSWDNANTNQTSNVVWGHCRNGMTVSIIPFRHICRLATCNPQLRSSYTVWHKGGMRSLRDKISGSRYGQTWFLRYKWTKIHNKLRGQEWLSSIAYWGVTHS